MKQLKKQIKPEELRRGNLVMSPDGKSFFEVVEILREGVTIKGYGKIVKYKDLWAIPITDEWLLKLGFSMGRDYDLYKEKHYSRDDFKSLADYGGQDVVICKKTKQSWVECGYYGNQIPLDYVHVLQNVFFLLEKRELWLSKNLLQLRPHPNS